MDIGTFLKDITQNTKVVSTAIAFDPGWKVYADEKEVEVLKTNLGFVGFELSEGKHEITMVYTPPGYNVGKYITFGAFGLVIVGVVLRIIKKNKNLYLNKNNSQWWWKIKCY